MKGDNEEEYLEHLGFTLNTKNQYDFNHNAFSRFFLKYTDIILLKNEEELLIYNQRKGVYEINCEAKIAKAIKFVMNQAIDIWNPYYETLVLKTLKRDISKLAPNFNDGEYINLQDGILDLETYELLEHTPEILSTVQLPFLYTKRTLADNFHKYLDDVTCGDKEKKKILQELAGYCLSNSTKAEKAFFLYGSGCNGKSVFAQVLQMLVGEGNYSNTNLSALGGNFGLASLVNANVNIAAENSSGRINSEIFKAIVSGDTVEVNRKYKESLSIKLHTKLVLLFNTLPDSDDLSYGFFRKILIIPFDKKIEKNEMDVELLSKLENELPEIFHWAVEGLTRLRNNNYMFSKCTACDYALEKYKRTLNPVAEFFEENLEVHYGDKIKRSEIYKAYSKYCSDNALELMHCQKFWRALKAHFADREINFEISKIKGYEYVRNISFQ